MKFCAWHWEKMHLEKQNYRSARHNLEEFTKTHTGTATEKLLTTIGIITFVIYTGEKNLHYKKNLGKYFGQWISEKREYFKQNNEKYMKIKISGKIRPRKKDIRLSVKRVKISNASFLCYLIGQNFGGQNFRRTKFFGGQNFRHQLIISAVLSDENFSLVSYFPIHSTRKMFYINFILISQIFGSLFDEILSDKVSI